jgi:hypothetical protein
MRISSRAWVAAVCGLAIWLLLNNAVAVQAPDDLNSFLTAAQSEAVDAAQRIYASLPADEASRLRAKRIGFIAAPPGSRKGWCASPWSAGSNSRDATGKPVVVVCPYTIVLYAHMLTAWAVTSGVVLRTHIDEYPTETDLKAMEARIRANEMRLTKQLHDLIAYYASTAAANFTSSSLRRPENIYCQPEVVVYLTLRGRGLTNCSAVPEVAVALWLRSVGLTTEQIHELWWRTHRGMYDAIVGHEMGHIASNEGEPSAAIQAEVDADNFALKVFGKSVDFLPATQILMSLNIFWKELDALDLKTIYPLTSHEETRLVAASRTVLCGPFTAKDSTPEFARAFEQYRSFLRKMFPTGICEDKR